MPENLEVKIGKLEEQMKALKENVSIGNTNILSEIKELKDNFANRLERVETTKLAATDFINYKGETATILESLQKELQMVRDRQLIWSGGIAVAVVVTEVLIQIALKRL